MELLFEKKEKKIVLKSEFLPGMILYYAKGKFIILSLYALENKETFLSNNS